MVNEVKKRTKPCISCKLSKVKCEYTEALPCKRCLKLGIHCQFVRDVRRVQVPVPVPPAVPVPAPVPAPGNGMAVPHRISNIIPVVPPVHGMGSQTSNRTIPQAGGQPVAPPSRENGDSWTNNIDNRLNNFESLLETMLSALYKNNIEQQSRMGQMQKEINSQARLTQSFLSSQKNNRRNAVKLPNLSQLEQSLETSQWQQQLPLQPQPQQQQQQQPQSHSSLQFSNGTSIPPLRGNGNPTFNEQQQSSVTTSTHHEIIDNRKVTVTDFRTAGSITKEQAKVLLDYFIQYFSPHLFGFTLGGVSVQSLWSDSPLLLASICTIACCHHPELDYKFHELHSSLHWFASQLLLPTDAELNVEHTILGLIIASLWLSSSKMFSSLALHLARVWRVDQLYSPQFEKLWYLLYILDGSENLTSHKSPSIYKDMEPLIKDSRRLIIDGIEKNSSGGQFFRKAMLEYDQRKKHTATHKQLELLNEVRSEKLELSHTTLQDLRLLTQLEYHMAMESVFHNKNTRSPSLHDESLEATMTLLPTEKFGIPWTNNMDLDKWMISWTIALQNIKVQNDPWCFKSTLLYYNFARMHINTKALLQGKKSTLLDSLENVELIKLWHPHSNSSEIKESADSTELSATKEISRSSALALLKLATKDKDLTQIFQFFPTHIYVMLYYASLVVLNPSMIAERSEKECKQSYALVTKLKKMLQTATISDKTLKDNLIKALYQLLVSFKQELAAIDETSRKVYELLDENDEKETTGKQGRRPILAWPGTNPGHP